MKKIYLMTRRASTDEEMVAFDKKDVEIVEQKEVAIKMVDEDGWECFEIEAEQKFVKKSLTKTEPKEED